jgi:Ca2+-binding RTX toxin-like protein
MISHRHVSTHSKMSLPLCALLGAAALTLSAPAGAATYPQAGGNDFDGSAQDWTSAVAECTTSAGSAPGCTQENVFEADGGRDGTGGIVARTTVLINGGELFSGASTWRSPSFAAQANNGAGNLRYDRNFEVSGPVAPLSPRAEIEAVLVDESTGGALSLGTEVLSESDTAFGTRQLTVAPGSLVAGRSYHLELRSTTTTTVARVGVQGSAEVHYDNVALSSTNPSGASGSEGVTFPGAPIGASALNQLASRVSLFAEVGSGPGGSLVPLARCTILGTPGNDRIKGSRGNDVICGLGGKDRIAGGRGRDLIDAANGNDRVAGSTGNDTMLGLAGRDRVSGGSGKDRAGAGAGGDRIAGGGGNDRLVGASGADRLNGGAGKDRLNGGRGGDRIKAGAGSDGISARDRRRDRVNGGRGRDWARIDRRGRGVRRADLVRAVERRR